jgi:2-amino-4-hydroxy-6-hydroxymethyldihydropteridine diphosphokinase
VACSAVYRTEPVGGPAQPDYLNIAVEVASALEPRPLLEAALEVERQRGRQRGGERCGPRTLDVDLLLYGDARIRQPGLRLPHPRCHLRRFVLVPLAELAPERIHPEMGLTVADLLARCADRAAVIRVESPLSLPPVRWEGRVESPETFG